MKYIIMAGGSYDGWQVPKQLTPVNGVPVIERTLRLLRAEGIEPFISSNDERFAAYAPLLRHENDFAVRNGQGAGAWVNGFYPTEEAACYIFGDVVFSPAGIRTIVNTDTAGVAFFASTPPFSPQYIKPYAEPFAFKVADQKRFRAAVDYCRANVDTGVFSRHPIAWELWAVLQGTDVRQIDYSKIVPINDYTCDIDSPADAEKLGRILCGS